MLKKKFSFLKKSKIISLLILLTITGTIGYCSTLTGGPSGISFSWMATAYHFVIFFLFAFFLSLFALEGKSDRKEIFFVIIISLITAILDETHQIFVPFRDAGIKDIITDFSGSILGMISFLFINKRLSNNI